MNSIKILMSLTAVMAVLFVACDEATPVDPEDNPASQQMNFQSGARYAYTSYSTDPNSGEKIGETERNRELTLVGTSLAVQGRTGVALYLDSIFGIGGNFEVLDSLLLYQEPGTNNVYRYGPLAPELSFTGFVDIDLRPAWMHEARLGSSSASWFSGSIADTIPYTIPSVPLNSEGIEISLSDSAVGSSIETVAVGGESVATTRTTHSLTLSLSYLVELPIVGITPIEFASVALTREIWFSAELGAIVRERREGRVIDAEVPVPNFDANISIPIPGYYLEMVSIE